MNAPLLPRATWTHASTESIKTGTWRAAMPLHIRAPSPCHVACPVGGEIAEWIGQARAGHLRRAWDTLTRHNPFPAIAGRVCHHPCEAACNRASHDSAIAICKLERHVGDAAIAGGWAFAPPAVQRSESVAVVGGGPAGLSAAFQLRRRGYRVIRIVRCAVSWSVAVRTTTVTRAVTDLRVRRSRRTLRSVAGVSFSVSVALVAARVRRTALAR